MKQLLEYIIFSLISLNIQVQANTPWSYSMPDGSGILQLGTDSGKFSQWLNLENLKKVGLSVRYFHLKETTGFLIEITNMSDTQDVQLAWILGGFDSPSASKKLLPLHCKDNVFNAEGNHITIYHGKVMQLKVTQAIVPPESFIQLADGNSLGDPATLFQSSPKTEAPILYGRFSLKKGEKSYFCLYKRNHKADYLYYMLPQLIQTKKTIP